MKELQIDLQRVALDFAIVFGDEFIVHSIFDRSAVIVRAMAARSTFEGVFIEGTRYFPVYDGDRRTNYPCKRYIERFASGRDRVTSAMVVSDALNDKYVITDSEHARNDLYSFLMNKYPVPILKQWVDYIINEAMKSHMVLINNNVVISDNIERKVDLGHGLIKLSDIIVYRFGLSLDSLKDIITTGLRNKKIMITTEKVEPLNFQNLDQYYERYGDNIVHNLEGLINPLIEENGYCPYTATMTKRLFPAQGNGVNAMMARLKRSKYAIANEDMGTGKTLQALAMADAYFNQKYLEKNKGLDIKDLFLNNSVNYRVAVICPPHVVDKWVSEASEIANMHAQAVTSLEQLVDINLNRERYSTGKHLFVFSKDFAKLGETYAPIPSKEALRVPFFEYCSDCFENSKRIVIRQFGETKCSDCGSKRFEKRVYASSPEYTAICPYCSEALMENSKEIKKSKPMIRLTLADFQCQTSSNKVCYHCGSVLWGAQVKNLNSTPNYTWKKMIYFTNKSHKSKKSAFFTEKNLRGLVAAKNLEPDEWWETSNVGTRKYSPARYVSKHMKNFFDFLIADEAHLYESDAAQGQAFASLIGASKKVLALTGTLTNGKASGLFNLFWRLDPKKMKDKGFTYRGEDGISKWNETYGVLESRQKVEESATYNSSSRGKKMAMARLRPGVSPLIMKDFLLDCVVQLQISELSDGLPELNEYIEAVEPEAETYNSLQRLTDLLKTWAKDYECPAISSQALIYDLFYLDKPYGLLPIKNPLERGKYVVEPDNFSYMVEDGKLLAKERKLIDIVNKELGEGRCCYIYLEKSSRESSLCLIDRIKEVVEQNVKDSKVLIMESNTVSAIKRESWLRNKVEKEGYNVVISNPRLVETGIDFIWKGTDKQTYNFPTLIFYQVGWRLDTLWQASRRAYRLIQPEECRTYYIVYEGTMQTECLELMAEKQVAVSAIQGGEFSSRGLASMAKGVDPKIELAKRMAEGKHTSVGEIQKMFKSISLSAKKEWRCEKNKLICEVVDVKELQKIKTECHDNDVIISKTVIRESFGDFFEWDNSFVDIFAKTDTENNKKKTGKEKRDKEQYSFMDLFMV